MRGEQGRGCGGCAGSRDGSAGDARPVTARGARAGRDARCWRCAGPGRAAVAVPGERGDSAVSPAGGPGPRAPLPPVSCGGLQLRFPLPQLSAALSHVRLPGEPAVLRVRGLGREAQHHRLGGRGSAVFHRLVDHHRCCGEIPSGGRFQPFLPRLWGHCHHRVPDDQRRVQRAGERGQLQRGLPGPDRGSDLALHWLHDGFWVPHCFHVDPFWGLRG
uniref:Uncharacterized protein n=1 Tax=Cyanoderma ruficeps TaxID=181631 RepID=A0A8C3NR02_9PASS